MSESDFQRILDDIARLGEGIAAAAERSQRGVQSQLERRNELLKLKSLQTDIAILKSNLDTLVTLMSVQGRKLPDEQARRASIQALEREARALEARLNPRRWWQFWRSR